MKHISFKHISFPTIPLLPPNPEPTLRDGASWSFNDLDDVCEWLFRKELEAVVQRTKDGTPKLDANGQPVIVNVVKDCNHEILFVYIAKMCRKLEAQPNEAEITEAFSECQTKLLEKYGTFQPEIGHFELWFRNAIGKWAIVNCCKAAWKRVGKYVSIDETDEDGRPLVPESPAVDPTPREVSDVDRASVRGGLEKYLSQLKPKQKEIIEFVYFSPPDLEVDAKLAVYATAKGITHGAARRRYYRVMPKLRELMGGGGLWGMEDIL